MLRRFQDNLESTGLVPPGARVLVGYSGGADSTCLLHLLKASGTDIVAAHLHHGQRPEADDELEKCSTLARSLGVPFVSGKADVPRLAEDTKTGLEEAGRNARYAFFQSALQSTGCHLVATAHTLDDHVETVLMNLARGCGLAGLAGIPLVRHNIVRPMLGFRRAETRRYCDDHGLWFHDDPANFDLGNTRTRIRHRVLPEMETVNPAFLQSIERLSSIANEEDQFLDALSVSALKSCEHQLNGPLWFLTKDCEVAFVRPKLMEQAPVLVKRAVRLVVEALGGMLDFDATVRLVESFITDKGSWTATGGAVAVEWDLQVVHFRQLRPDEPFRHALVVPGETESTEFEWALAAQFSDDLTVHMDRGSLGACLDPARLHGDLYFRTAATGESMAPIGLKGTKKLSDMFQEAGLTSAARKRLPVVCDMVGPVWVPGVALAERVKMTENSVKSLRMRLSHCAGPDGTAGGVCA